MTTTTATRRLAAIFAADVVGYSRLMGADEEGTHERLKAHMREVVDPKIREHHGRIVKHTGDGVLAEFASVVDAVRCAGEIQRAMADRDLDLAAERRLRFRIGVNLGDVIADGGDISRRRRQCRGAPRSARRAGRHLRFPDGARPHRETSCPIRSRIGASRASRTSRGRCGSMRWGPRPWPICRRRAR